MRKIGIGSGQYIRSWDEDFCEAFRTMKSHGFDSVDLGIAVTEPSPRNIYEKSDEDFERILEDVKNAADKEGIEPLADVCAAAFRLIDHSSFDRNAAALLESMGVRSAENMARLTLI